VRCRCLERVSLGYRLGRSGRNTLGEINVSNPLSSSWEGGKYAGDAEGSSGVRGYVNQVMRVRLRRAICCGLRREIANAVTDLKNRVDVGIALVVLPDNFASFRVRKFRIVTERREVIARRPDRVYLIVQ